MRKTTPLYNSFHQKLGKQLAVLVCIHYGSFDTKSTQCLDASLRTVQPIQKELDESNSDYKNTAAQKLPSDCSDKKRSLYFLGHNWLRSQQVIRPIPRDMNAWVSYQAVSAWRHSVFIIKKMREGCLSSDELQSERSQRKAFEKIQEFPLIEKCITFSQMRNISAMIR